MRLKFTVDDIAIRLYLFALLIITLVPFGRGSFSGLEPAVPFIILSFIIFSLKKKYIDKKKWLVILVMPLIS
nr:MAG TPA: hypothetical protein [Caudoviricetes sp.]